MQTNASSMLKSIRHQVTKKKLGELIWRVSWFRVLSMSSQWDYFSPGNSNSSLHTNQSRSPKQIRWQSTETVCHSRWQFTDISSIPFSECSNLTNLTISHLSSVLTAKMSHKPLKVSLIEGMSSKKTSCSVIVFVCTKHIQLSRTVYGSIYI